MSEASRDAVEQEQPEHSEVIVDSCVLVQLGSVRSRGYTRRLFCVSSRRMKLWGDAACLAPWLTASCGLSASWYVDLLTLTPGDSPGFFSDSWHVSVSLAGTRLPQVVAGPGLPAAAAEGPREPRAPQCDGPQAPALVHARLPVGRAPVGATRSGLPRVQQHRSRPLAR